jgi:hypothetical protein
VAAQLLTQGYDDAIKKLIDAFNQGSVNKEDLAAALHVHEVAVNASKIPQRMPKISSHYVADLNLRYI